MTLKFEVGDIIRYRDEESLTGYDNLYIIEVRDSPFTINGVEQQSVKYISQTTLYQDELLHEDLLHRLRERFAALYRNGEEIEIT